MQWRFEREKGRNDAAQDLSDLSEGEREKGESNQTGSIKDVPRISSYTQLWPDDKSRQLYIVLIRQVKNQQYSDYDKTGSFNAMLTMQSSWAGSGRRYGARTRL